MFGQLSDAQQLQILGPAKYAAFKDGKIGLKDVVGQRYDPRWGTMRYEKSLKDVLGAEEAKKYYPSVERKMLGFSFYKPEIFGSISQVRRVYELGYKAKGWAFYEDVFRKEYLTKFGLRDDIEWTVGLWGSPEPSFNARLKGGYRNVIRLARQWGKDFNQDGMVLLIPSKGAKGGVLSWDFGRELSLGEMDRLLDGLMAVNAELKPGDPFDFIGLTVKGRRKVEFWISDNKKSPVGIGLIQRAMSRAGLNKPNWDWKGGYEFISIDKKNY